MNVHLRAVRHYRRQLEFVDDELSRLRYCVECDECCSERDRGVVQLLWGMRLAALLNLDYARLLPANDYARRTSKQTYGHDRREAA